MKRQYLRTGGIAVIIGSVAFADAYGGRIASVAAYVLVASVGGFVYSETKTEASRSVFGSALVGVCVGSLLSLGLATALLVTFVGAPVDAAAWFAGVRLSFSWVGLGFALLSSHFLISSVALLG